MRNAVISLIIAGVGLWNAPRIMLFLMRGTNKK